jgi:8-oxo-(d)GTP phosphatase
MLSLVLSVRSVLALAIVGFALWAPAARAQDFWAELKKPGRMVLLRHAYAPGDTDKDLDNLKNCKTQRNLDETGRGQAARTGDEFRRHGIKQARIYSSQYCRALETGRLLKLGSVTELALLNQLFYAQLSALSEATEKVRQAMKSLSGKGPAILVSHVSNIQSLAGVQLTSGEMAVVHLDPAGNVAVVGRALVK